MASTTALTALIPPATSIAILLLRLLGSVTLIWLVAWGLTVFFARRSSASLRHRIWSLSTAAVLLLPALLCLLPDWQVAHIPAPAIALVPPSAMPAPLHDSTVTIPMAPREVRETENANHDEASAARIPSAIPQAIVAIRKAPSRYTVPPTPASVAFTWRWRLVGLWFALFIFLLIRQIRAIAGASQMARRATPIIPTETAAIELALLTSNSHNHSIARLLQSSEVSSPMCVGIRRACIVLPADHRTWPAAQLRATLAHELAHAVRRDVAWQALARLACAIYWFHPLAWVAAWRMRDERELACDDRVLHAGHESTQYARLLVQLAESLTRSDARFERAAVAMASRQSFEGRLRALLDGNRPRRPISRRAAFTLSIAGMVLLVLTAIVNPIATSKSRAAVNAATQPATTQPAATAPSQRDTLISGRVIDQTGKPASGVIIETNYGPISHSAVTDQYGHFSLDLSDSHGVGHLWVHTPDGKFQTFLGPIRASLPATDPSPQLTLRPAREFPITAVDEQGKPVPDAWIAASSNFMLVGQATTDAAGHAVLRVPADAPLAYALAIKNELAIDYFAFWRKDESRIDPYRLSPDYAGPLRFTLGRAITATVHVLDEKRGALQGVDVSPWLFMKPRKGGDLNLFSDPHFHRLTDAQGRARFDFIPADNEQKINFWTRLQGYTEKGRCLYDPKSGNAVVEQTMLPLVHLTGRVLDRDGHPAPSVPVHVGGSGYDFDDFTGNATTDLNGVFAIDVAPQKFYMFVATKGHLASVPGLRIVNDQPPAEPIQLKLEPGVRIHGMATMGPGHIPVPNTSISLVQQVYDSYRQLPESQRFPGGLAGRKSIIPHIFHANTKTDAQGNFEFYASAGRFYVDGFYAATRVIEHMTVPDGQDFEINLHTEGTGEQYIKGRVILAAKPDTTVAEAKISGAATGVEQIRVAEGFSDKQGNFSVRQGRFDLYLSARTPDGLRGITLVKNTEHTATIAVGPTASAYARIVDANGHPIANRSVTYAFRVDRASQQPGKYPPTFSWEFGGTVLTDEQGFVTATGLVPGYEYEFNAATAFNPEGKPRSWHRVGKVKPEKAERIELHDLLLPDPPRQKTAQDYAVEAFHPAKTFDERVQNASHVASVSFQRLLIIAGDPNHSASKKFFEYRHDIDSSDAWKALADFVLIPIDTVAHDAASEKWAKASGLQWPPVGVVLAVFEPNGRLVAQATVDALSTDGILDRQKLIAFARANAPILPDAQKLLDDALARAAKQNVNVLIDESAAYCGWCVRLTDYFNANAATLDKHFVRITLDRRMPHGKDVIEKLRASKLEDRFSTPWTVVLAPDGHVVITSDSATGNIGYPGEPGGRVHWEKLIRTGAPRMSDAEIALLLAAIK